MKKKLLCLAFLATCVTVTVVVAQKLKVPEISPEFLAKLEKVEPQARPKLPADRTAPDLAEPVRLEADGKPIDIGTLSNVAHAGPWIADVDEDGDRDLVVGDFPGYFWYFENIGTEHKPDYTGRGKLQAGGEDAKTPVY